MLKIFNTITKKKEIFIPYFSNIVNFYVCGITVYDYCHIGHARTFISFDMMIRYLNHCKYKVKYIRNITDIDDKIINKSKKFNKKISDFTDEMIINMNKDFLDLGLIPPYIEPRVTNHINDIIFMIEKLISKNHAYIGLNGDVLFSVNSFKKYGRLSKQNKYKLKMNNLVNLMDEKNSDYDFVLWKKKSFLDSPNWNSPWGFGRPGWHIECSAINNVFFGKYIDIHGGGSDLIFPHHENEIAQSVCYNNQKDYGKYWVHVGSLLIKNQKMSKSLLNTILLRDLLKKYNSEIIRYFFLSTHYRKPLYYNSDNIYRSVFSLRKFYIVLQNLYNKIIIKNKFFVLKYQYFCIDFYHAMYDDFNTPKAISVLFSILKEVNLLLRENKLFLATQLIFQLKYLSRILGLLNQDPKKFLKYLNNLLIKK
ncbi:cysteine--tRNA ligase [Buchnera aphidicola]|uniref:cysteine--tRNA ligase n=1 Tax=Buchnera aphidicola TaxID=9 RepID=UPI0034641C43